MKTLRLAKFSPIANTVTRYWIEDDFKSCDILSTSSLTETQQAVIAAALEWSLTQLPAGFDALESVELKRVSDVVTEWSTPENPEDAPEPLTYSPAFMASIVGSGTKGQGAVEISSQPGPETDGLASLWDALS